jgi:hypothetical protein
VSPDLDESAQDDRAARGSPSRLRILVSGASGLVGSALVPRLETHGHEVIRLVRRRPSDPAHEVEWDPAEGRLDASSLRRVDAVVHLAGESLASGRWTRARKARIWQSRIQGTRLLSETLAALHPPPLVLVSASAVGFYGDRGDEILREDSTSGTGFLAELCRAWEQAPDRASRAGVRAVQLRLGIVLAPAGGVLGRLLPPFRLGLGTTLGTGSQFTSWISIDDLLDVILLAIATPGLAGPVNATSPQPVTNRDLTRTLARALGRPAVFKAPAPLLRLLAGEMAQELLLSSQRAEPARLLAAGYRFRHANLEGALRHLLGKPAPASAQTGM